MNPEPCGSIYPVLVAELPFTEEFYRQWAKKLGREPELDHGDDCYTVYACDTGHEHPECWRCLPYYGKIAKRVLERLHACKRRAERENRRYEEEEMR